MALTVPLGVLLFAVACLLLGGIEQLPSLPWTNVGWLSLAGVIHFVIGRYGNYHTIRALGNNLSTPIQQVSIPISVVLALIFLDEVMTVLKLAGFALIMIGPFVAMRPDRKPKQSAASADFHPRYREGILWGLLSSLAYGVSPLFIMMGLTADGGIAGSVAAGFVSYSAAAAVLGVIVLLSGGVTFMRRLDRGAARWFLASGVLVFLSQMFRYMALAFAPISVVIPIQRLSMVFRLLFGWALNRDHEVFGTNALLGIAISFVGAIALALSTDLVGALLPASWAAVLTRGWP